MAACVGAVLLDAALPDPPPGLTGIVIVWVGGWLFITTLGVVAAVFAARATPRTGAVEDPT